MSEEKTKKSLLELMQQSQMTYAEAEEKSKQEAGRPKVERYRIGEEGEYPIRILPLAPTLDEEGRPLELKRKGYEYPIHQQFLKIKLPSKKGKKAKEINVPVVRTSDKEVGFSVDLIDTYAKIAKELYPDDEELIKKMGENSFHNDSSLKWNYQHAIYVLDVDSDKGRAKGPQLWQCSHSVYKALDDAKMRLWQKMIKKDADASDPVAGFVNSYDVSIIRKNNNGKTEYAVEIGRDFDDLTEEEVEKLLDLPRIPELIYHFSRYQLEAELVFLQQYDEIHDLDVCKESDFIEAVEKLKGELPADDNSHFDVATAGTGRSDSKSVHEITVDDLWNEYDSLNVDELDEKSEDYQDFREKLRQFAEDNDLDVRLSRSKNNKQLLEEIEEAYDDKQKDAKTNADKDSDKSDDDEKKPVDKEDDEDKDKSDEDERPRRRRPRPKVDDEPEPDEDEGKESADEDKEPGKGDEPEEKADEKSAEETERPALHRRRRR